LVLETGRRYGDDPWISQSVADLIAVLSDPQDQEAVWREQTAVWRAAADAASGIARYVLRQHALELALNHGLSDLAAEIRRDLQEMTVEELDLKQISAEVEIPASEIDAVVEWIADAETWQRALLRIGAQGPPTGQIEANEQAVRQAATEFAFRWLTTDHVIGPHRSLVFRADSEEKKIRLEMARQEGFGLVIFGPLLVRMLHRFHEHFGEPPEVELAEFLTCAAFDRALARRCAQAVAYYWRGEFDAAGHLLAPRIEAGIRHMCARVGIPVTKLPRGEEPGGVITLGLLLARLEGRVDESWRRYLAHVLADPLGLNIRNDISHGLIEAVDEIRVALLIHVMLFLVTLRVTDAGE
jgi:hypothetical protein